MKNNKDKSIKKTMRSWIMLSDKELDDTQVYMQEQENMDTTEKESDKEALEGRQRLSREEEIEQLTQEVGQEVVDENDEEMPMPRRRRKRHDDKKKESSNEETEQLGQEEVAEPEETSDQAQPELSQKPGVMGKVITAGVGIVLVLIIGGLGYQNQALQRQNQRLKKEVVSLEKEKKQAEQASEEQALQTKNEDGVVVNTDKLFDFVKVGDKEYKLLCKVSDFTKDGWKLEALRTENATLVPGGKLEKDAFLTNADGRKIGVIIRNMSDKNQKVSDCIITKLSFSKEMFDEQITLPGNLTFSSTEKELKKAGFKKDADGAYCYTSKRIKDDSIKMNMADGESVSDITLERTVDESGATATTASSSATTAASEDKTNNETLKNATTEEENTVEDFSQGPTDTVTEE